MVGTYDALCVDRGAVGAGYIAGVCGAEVEVLSGEVGLEFPFPFVSWDTCIVVVQGVEKSTATSYSFPVLYLGPPAP